MFNEETKKWYLDENKEKEILLTREFEKSAAEEIRLGKDMYDFTASEIRGYYKLKNIYSYEALLNIHYALSNYTRWALNNNLVRDHQNHFEEVTASDLRQCLSDVKINQLIISRDELLNRIEELPNACDKFLILAIFEGISGYGNDNIELINARTTDINGNEMELCTGRKVLISNELKKYALDAAEQETYLTIGGNIRQLEIQLENDKTLIFKGRAAAKSEGNRTSKGRRLYNTLKKCFSFMSLSESITSRKLMDSGMIHFINEDARNLGITAKEYCSNSNLYARLERQYGQKFMPWNFIKKYDKYLQ